MCGICGFTGRPDRGLIERMARSLAHRGPDGEGVELLDGACLGHRRLAVIDSSPAGRGPMPNEDGGVWLTHDGGVYNSPRLGEGLLERGHRFRSRTDAECIVHLYEEKGEACLEDLEGAFAFAVWDSEAKSLFLARDRLGERPLYYAVLPEGQLAFASEMKALLLLPRVSRELDFRSLDEYLSYLYVPAPRTMFRGISELPPGHAAAWKDGSFRTWRYWQPPSRPAERPVTPEEVASLLESSVRSRMIADVPLGAFLSGGIDSSSIVAFMAKNSTRPVKTFTVVFGEEGAFYDERERARRVSERFGTDHAEIEARADVAELLGAMVRHFDEPFGNPTALLSYLMAREARKHVTVALAGDGGDEIFGGYPRYRGLLWAKRLAVLPPGLRRALPVLARAIPESIRGRHWPRRAREFFSTAALSPRDAYASWVGYYSPSMKARLYTNELRGQLGDPPRLIEGLLDEGRGLPPVGMAQRCDLQSFLPFNCLRYGDRMSGAHALELRLPMLDRELVERCLPVADGEKLRGGRQKLLLRRAMRGILPDDVLDAPKVGFNPPMGVWLVDELKPLAEGHLAPDAVRGRGLFDPSSVQGMLRLHFSGKRDFSWHIWSLIVLEEWFRMYQD